jgi:hypothetical protein
MPRFKDKSFVSILVCPRIVSTDLDDLRLLVVCPRTFYTDLNGLWLLVGYPLIVYTDLDTSLCKV